jgi:opacity protein-like surface antigen
VVAALPRRRFASALLAALQLLAVIALLAMPSAALAAPRDVLRDYNDNGQIDGCYTAQDYQRALDLVNPDDAQYGAEVDTILQAQADRVLQPDGSCAPATASNGGDSGSGVPGALIAVLIVAGVAVAGGGGLWAYRRTHGGGGGDGPSA